MKFYLFCFFLSLYLIHYSTEAQISQILEGHQYNIHSLSFSNDGHYLASGSGDARLKAGEIKLWDMQTLQEAKITFAHNDYVADVGFSPTGYILFSGGGFEQTNNLKMWSVLTGTARQKFQGQEAISCLAVDSYGRYLVSGGLDKSLKKWDIANGYSIFNYYGHKFFVLDANISPNGQYVASCGGDYKNKQGEIKIWGLNDNNLVAEWGNLPQVVNSVMFSPDSKVLAAALENGKVLLYDVSSQTLINSLQNDSNEGVLCMAFSADGKYLATGGKDKLVRIWDLSNYAPIATWSKHTGSINCIAFSLDNQHVVTAGQDKKIIFWRLNSYKRKVEKYVQEKLTEWYQKGKFEKTEDYKKRTSDENKELQIKQVSHQYIQELGNLYVDLKDFKGAKNQYDADNETFKITYKNLTTMLVRVPLQEAESFDRNFERLQIKQPVYALNTQDELVLTHAEIFNPANFKTYVFDTHKDLPIFQPQDFQITLQPVEIEPIITQEPIKNPEKKPLITASDVDFNLPKTRMNNPDAVAVVIGNSLYTKTKPVKFALQDAKIMKKYLIEVLGFRESNILYVENASYSDFKIIFGEKGNHQGKLFALIKPQKSDVFVFYSGHGAPSLKNKQSYFVPVECEPQYVELMGYSTDIFYENLALLPAKSVSVVIDACFSGIDLFENISPIVIRSKGIIGIKNGILLASSKAEQVSCWYNEQMHGMFTYFFLKAIHNKNADFNKDNQLSWAEIYQFISDSSEGIPYYARRLRGVEQNPVLNGEDTQKILVSYE